MNIILITYDLINASARDYSAINNRIKSFGNWAKPLESVWIVETFKTQVEIRDELRAVTYPDDKLLVINITNDMWGSYNILSEVTAWMQKVI